MKNADPRARLIPGSATAVRVNAKKPVQSIKLGTGETEFRMPEHPFTLLLPAPLQSRTAWSWLRSTLADFALVGLNWLLIGALPVPLHAVFPQMRLFSMAAGSPVSLLGVALLHGALITLLGHSEGLYAEGAKLPQQARLLGKSVLLATAILSCAYGLQDSWAVSGLICAAGVLHFGALLIWRWQTGRPDFHSGPRQVRNVLIVGAGRVGRSIEAYLQKHPETGRVVCGFLDNAKPLDEKVIGRVSNLSRIARTKFVDEVILAAPEDRSLTLDVLLEARRLHLDVEIVPELFGCNPAGTEVGRVGDLPVIWLHAERLPAVRLMLKRAVDLVGAGFALSILSPFLAIIAVLIKLDSPGPVFYCASRAGRKGRLFRCYKFRTMVSNADELKDRLRQHNQRSGPFFKLADDPRITRVGHFLRRYSLDELPQFWNVLKGDMSLVGPRPHPLDDVAAYEVEHLARLDVTPGITGLWQVTARRDPSFQRGMELDREYIRTWSLQSDMRILLKTVRAVVQGSGD
jgi:exopolysaccharide biosynthesis polyprenyl glycosylphosphotransferase